MNTITVLSVLVCLVAGAQGKRKGPLGTFCYIKNHIHISANLNDNTLFF